MTSHTQISQEFEAFRSKTHVTRNRVKGHVWPENHGDTAERAFDAYVDIQVYSNYVRMQRDGNGYYHIHATGAPERHMSEADYAYVLNEAKQAVETYNQLSMDQRTRLKNKDPQAFVAQKKYEEALKMFNEEAHGPGLIKSVTRNVYHPDQDGGMSGTRIATGLGGAAAGGGLMYYLLGMITDNKIVRWLGAAIGAVFGSSGGNWIARKLGWLDDDKAKPIPERKVEQPSPPSRPPGVLAASVVPPGTAPFTPPVPKPPGAPDIPVLTP